MDPFLSFEQPRRWTAGLFRKKPEKNESTILNEPVFIAACHYNDELPRCQGGAFNAACRLWELLSCPGSFCKISETIDRHSFRLRLVPHRPAPSIAETGGTGRIKRDAGRPFFLVRRSHGEAGWFVFFGRAKKMNDKKA
jgi:hypothetical protein